jgi:hypothetical protein
MGAIKDIVDLTTQLSNSVNDRKIATELSKIQTLTLQLQSEQAELHENEYSSSRRMLEIKRENSRPRKEITNSHYSIR